MIALARDYASKRRAFGKSLSELPLHTEALMRMVIKSESVHFLGSELERLLDLLAKYDSPSRTNGRGHCD